MINVVLSTRLNLGFNILKTQSPYLDNPDNAIKATEEELIALTEMFLSKENLRKHILLLQTRRSRFSKMIAHLCFENEEIGIQLIDNIF